MFKKILMLAKFHMHARNSNPMTLGTWTKLVPAIEIFDGVLLQTADIFGEWYLFGQRQFESTEGGKITTSVFLIPPQDPISNLHKLRKN